MWPGVGVRHSRQENSLGKDSKEERGWQSVAWEWPVRRNCRLSMTSLAPGAKEVKRKIMRKEGLGGGRCWHRHGSRCPAYITRLGARFLDICSLPISR